MIKTETYLVINPTNIYNLKTIKHFKLNLGTSLTTENKFLPNDPIMQKHYMFFDEIINKCGNIGGLNIYSTFKNDINTISVYNEKEKYIYNINHKISYYENINEALNQFFIKHNLVQELKPEIEEIKETKKNVYVKPDKNLSEMTLEERILFARNRN